MLIKQSAMSRYLQQYESIYPGIEKWYQSRVEPDVACGVKKIFRFDANFDIQGLGIIDLAQGKLCHLSIQHAVRGSGLGFSILNLTKRELKNNNHNKIWCHAPENIVEFFSRWSKAIPVKSIGSFGRAGEKDVLLYIPIGNEVGINGKI